MIFFSSRSLNCEGGFLRTFSLLLTKDCLWIHESNIPSWLLVFEAIALKLLGLALETGARQRVQSSSGDSSNCSTICASDSPCKDGLWESSVGCCLFLILRTCAKEMGLARIFKQQRIYTAFLPELPIIITTMTMPRPPPFHTRNPLAGRTLNTPLLTLKTEHSLVDTEECTFEPKTNCPRSSKRSLKKFLHDQESYQHSRERKLQRMREELKDERKAEVTLSPAIDPGSRRLATRQSSSGSIFQRLSMKPPQRIQPTYPFSPKILNRSQSIKRSADVSSLLYNDAKRRQEKSMFMADTERSLTDRNSPVPQINSNAGKLAGRKVLTELEGLLAEEEMSPLVAVLVLEDLFHVDLNPARQGEALKSLLARISHTNDQHAEVVPAGVLREFVGIVVGADEPCSYFNPSEQQAIYKEFRYFYKERLGKERLSPAPEKPSFQPQTLPASDKLAQSHRDKACQRVGEFLQGKNVGLLLKEGEITIEELFILDGLRKQEENAKKKQEKTRKQLQECTFKPNITPISLPKQDQKRAKITLKPSKKASIPQPDPDKDLPHQKQNNRPSMTLLPPRSGKKPKRQSTTLNESSLKDMQKIMLRMAAGRQKREFSHTITERGYPQDQNWAQLQKNMHRKSVQNLEKMRRLSFKV